MATNQQENMLKMVADLEIEMMSDMYKRMTRSCKSKCISSNYREAELNKGEAVCLDRCLYKYLDVHEQLGKVLSQMTQQDEKQIQQIVQQQTDLKK